MFVLRENVQRSLGGYTVEVQNRTVIWHVITGRIKVRHDDLSHWVMGLQKKRLSCQSS